MGILWFALLALMVLFVYEKKGKKHKRGNCEKHTGQNPDEGIEQETRELPVENAYQKKWLFTYNEKDAYSKLKPIAEEMGYTVFAKVRLLDLVEPVKGNPKYKSYFYKIQAKHVDFVLCDQKLVARYVIELDDNNHEKESRKKRDAFVDAVLKDVGYKIIHVRAITDDIKTLLSE